MQSSDEPNPFDTNESPRRSLRQKRDGPSYSLSPQASVSPRNSTPAAAIPTQGRAHVNGTTSVNMANALRAHLAASSHSRKTLFGEAKRNNNTHQNSVDT